MAAGQIHSDRLLELLAWQPETRMEGIIRTKEKCRLCGSAYALIPKLERLGPACMNDHPLQMPRRFFIDLYWKKRLKIYSDKTGLVLDSYERALKLQDRITEEIENHTFDPSKYMRSELKNFWVSNLLDRFHEKKLKTIAPSYRSNYKRMVETAREHFGPSDVRELRKLDLIDYKEKIEAGLRGKTVKNYLDLFSVFLNWCASDLEIIERVPALPDVEVEEPNFRWLNQEEQIKVFDLVPAADKPILSCMILYGVRPGEARALRCKDVDLRTETMVICSTWSKDQLKERRKGRGAKKLVVPIHPEIRDYIVERVSGNLPEAFLFANPIHGGPYSVQRLRKVWAKVKAAAGISGIRMYDATRHSFGSQLVNAGVPINAVSDLMGHSSLKMTQRYAHGDLNLKATTLQKMSLKKVSPLTVPGVSPEAKATEKR